LNYLPRLVSKLYPPDLRPEVRRITGVSHQCLAAFSPLNKEETRNSIDLKARYYRRNKAGKVTLSTSANTSK
jgi:hypothetical protein